MSAPQANSPRTARAVTAALVTVTAGALVLTACGSGRTDSGGSGDVVTVGTTDQVYALDPAASYDNGSMAVMKNVYPFLLDSAPNTGALTPSAAEKCDFTAPTVYSCTLKSGLTFANGDPLTATSVKFTFDRMLGINDPNGPASLLANLSKTDAPNATTVNFTLKEPNDQTFPQVLTTNVGPIVDEKVFPADKILDDDAIVKSNAFGGQYKITSYQKNQLVEYRKNDSYNGMLGTPKTDTIRVKYYAQPTNLKLDIQQKQIDVAYRSLTPTDIAALRSDSGLTVHEGPGGELRYIVFNFDTMAGANPAQKLAVRKAIASSVDREAIAKDVYQDTYSPAYSMVAGGLPGAVDSYKIYGEKPDAAKARGFLAAAGVTAPVDINLWYNPDHYGSNSADEYAKVKAQLEATGLFRVTLNSANWETYNKARVKDNYPTYQLGWFPDFPDADNYLTPFLDQNNFLQSNFSNPQISQMLSAERTEADPTKRAAILADIQNTVAEDFVTTLPLLQGKQVAIGVKSLQGVTLDKSFTFRYGMLAKS
ncbi:MAG: ABC transporter substrate-binding protein [Corynebacteriales bacterium]|uniref:ABC transporter substrate-binding protein n=1 Tax=Williamsia herbipolensis TaxID=1603258 RepID=A0AAU4K0K4_9NOCA|nr:ABC transporter substrate-binding protein [Williamsia herbipolensis]MCX6468806.1 ABC transporter substrate-binding protein [Mycobacteriales bacterium]